MRLFNKRKLFYVISLVCCMILIVGFLFNNRSSKYNISYIINSFYMKAVESDEYKAGFKKTWYKNYKILHNKELEPSLPIIFTYLDKLEEESKDILGYIPEEELTIQFDYDEDVFRTRHSTFTDINDVAGYYNKESKTIYMNVEDVYRDVIINMPKTEYNSKEISISSSSFSEILCHEYSHYIYSSFINDNNINSENLPTWLNEGMAEYMSNSNIFEDKELDFIPLNKLDSSSEWEENMGINNKLSPYMQSRYIVYKMINLYSKNIMKDVIINCKDKTFNESFKAATNSSFNEFERKIKADFKNYTKMYDKSNDLVDESEHNRIKIKCLENYIKINEDDIRAYEVLSNYYESDFDRVVNFLKDSIKKHPREPFFWRRLAIVYEENNMLNLAKECFNKEEELVNK